MTADAPPPPMHPFCLIKLLPTVAAAIVVAVTVSLGFWQLDRAHQRDEMESKMLMAKASPPLILGAGPIDARLLEVYSAQAQGEWVPSRMVLLDNQIYQGQVGFQVLMPLRLVGRSMHVLVNRGWIKGTKERHQLPQVTTTDGTQIISGLIRQRTPQVGSVGKGARNGIIWSEATPEEFAAWSGLQMQPLILYQTSVAQDGLVRDWPQPGSGADRNRGYALQWFAFAVMTVIFWGYYSVRGQRKQGNEND
jgi:surfeit locus 1 family protein